MKSNKIFGKIDFKGTTNNPVVSDRSFDDGVVSVDAERIQSADSEPIISFDSNHDVTCSLLGYIINREELRTSYQLQACDENGIITELYLKFGTDFLYLLDGIFLIMLYDQKAKRLFLLTDAFGFILPIYFYQNGDGLLFSTSLKQILVSSAIQPRMNQDALRDLLFTQKCIPNEMTLVKGVTKLPAGFNMEVDLEKQEIHMTKASWEVKEIPREVGKKRLLLQVGENIAHLKSYAGKRIACSLSAGFDTNLVLHFLAGETMQSINTYTIGGKEQDEIPQTTEITSHYPSIVAKHTHVSDNKLNDLPRMVWDLEGYLLEGGIYLMDELGKFLETNDEQFVYSGEGGDGLFNSYKNMRVQKVRMHLIGTFSGYIYYRFIRPLFHLRSSEIQVLKKIRRPLASSLFSKGRDLNLKKIGIILNSYGVMGLHPFLSMEFRSCCKSLGKKLSRKKNFYKGEVRREVNPEIAEILTKLPGATDTWYLLKPYLHLLDPLLNTELCKNLFSKHDLRRIKQQPRKFEELIHQLFFIYTFQELFLSGTYDFSMKSPRVSLEDLFN